GDVVAALHDGTLVDVGVLVGTGIFDEVVDVDANLAGHVFVVIDANHDAFRVDVVHHAATARLHGGTRVDGNRALDARTDQGLLGTQARNRRPLHVGAHQRAVRVVML